MNLPTDTLVLTAYAKVNFTLDVLSTRPDGYHSMASVMQTVSLADTLTLTRRTEPGITLTCDAPDVPADSSNLVWRAAEAALTAAGKRDAGLDIVLTKRIPSQAGLGGGSSDAAATLRGVNLLCALNLTEAQIHTLAAALGSDVAFFLMGGTATARGRGEVLTPLPDAPPLWFVIVKPPVNVSTAWAYRTLDALPNRVSARATRRMEETLMSGEVERIVARISNDFEQAIFTAHLPLMLLHDELMMARSRNARLCGSGAALFGVCYTEAEAQETARIMRLKYTEVHVCRSVGRDEAQHYGKGDA